MNLTARNFEWFPESSSGAKTLGPLLQACSQVCFPFRISQRNSEQFTSDFDSYLNAKLLSCGAVNSDLSLPREITKQFDFVFAFSGKVIVVEVEKANHDKILYDFLKFHMYLSHGADFAVLYLPRNWPHKSGVVDIFECGRQRYQECLQFGFGRRDILDRILLVGYEQFSPDGSLLTSSILSALKDEWKRSISGETIA